MRSSGGTRWADFGRGFSVRKCRAAVAALFFLVLPGGLLAPPVGRAGEAGGISAGGGTRTDGTGVRLTDTVGAVGGGTMAGDGIRLTAGLLPEVTGVTPVTLVAFAAGLDASGAPRLEWTLSADSDPSGFHIYRSTTADGPWQRVTERPLPPEARQYVDVAAPAEAGPAAWYRLAALSREGIELLWGITVQAPARGLLPAAVALRPNYPNPFRVATTLSVELPAAGAVRLLVFDVGGREVATVFDGRLEAGRHGVVWDGRGPAGPVAAGVYFARLEVGNIVRMRKILIAR